MAFLRRFESRRRGEVWNVTEAFPSFRLSGRCRHLNLNRDIHPGLGPGLEDMEEYESKEGGICDEIILVKMR
jgi:hypothetical protein